MLNHAYAARDVADFGFNSDGCGLFVLALLMLSNLLAFYLAELVEFALRFLVVQYSNQGQKETFITKAISSCSFGVV